MFENLRNAFREAVENFNRELRREGVTETVDGLLKGMEKEAVATRSGLDSLKVCRRREALARKIGDADTAGIAAQFAEKHDNRQRVQSDKAKAIEAEIRLHESEYAEMIQQIRKARANRDSLAATAGRTQARGSINRTDDLFGELDRMADRIEGSADDAGATEDLFDDGPEFDATLRRSRREEVADARLEELKRRMGRE